MAAAARQGRKWRLMGPQHHVSVAGHQFEDTRSKTLHFEGQGPTGQSTTLAPGVVLCPVGPWPSKWRVSSSCQKTLETPAAPHPGVLDALMLVAPQHQVQEARQVVLSNAVLGVLLVGQAVLVQDADVKPALLGKLLRVHRAPPAAPLTRQ